MTFQASASRKANAGRLQVRWYQHWTSRTGSGAFLYRCFVSLSASVSWTKWAAKTFLKHLYICLSTKLSSHYFHNYVRGFDPQQKRWEHLTTIHRMFWAPWCWLIIQLLLINCCKSVVLRFEAWAFITRTLMSSQVWIPLKTWMSAFVFLWCVVMCR
jgi:hypothetical protein